MGSSVTWYNDNHSILHIRYQDTLRYSDLIAVNDEEARLLDGVDHPVGVIVDYSGLTRIPEPILANLPQLIVNAPRVNHPWVTRIVVCRTRPSIRLVYDTVLVVYQDLASRIAFAANLPDAEAILQQAGAP
jgi:hypothetical protein